MNIEKIAETLELWMQVETWYTTHLLDDKRFHRALAAVHSQHGFQISYDDYRDAMEYFFTEKDTEFF